MNSDTTLVNVGDEKIAKKVLNLIINIILLFIPSSLIAFLGIKSSLATNLLVTFGPSILCTIYYAVKISYRYFLVKRKLNQTFKQYSELDGQGFYFLDFINFLKNYDETTEKDKYQSLELKASNFSTKLKIKYSIFTNNLKVITENVSYGQTSSASTSGFAQLTFDKDNRNNFSIFYVYGNNANINADLNSSKINSLKDFEGYAKITVSNLKIISFHYVADFVNRYSFGSYNVSSKINEIQGEKKKWLIHKN